MRILVALGCITLSTACVLADDFVKSNTGGGAPGGSGGVAGEGSGAGGSTGVAGAGGTAGAGGSAGGDCLPENDDFAGSVLTGWSDGPDQNGGSALVDNGELTLTMTGGGPPSYGWYSDGLNDYHGWFIFRMACGDFAAVVDVSVVSASSPPSLPVNDYNSVGLLMRDPASLSGNENWLYATIGSQSPSAQAGGGTKPTRSSFSTPQFRSLTFTPTSGQVLICRVGPDIVAAARADGGAAWESMGTFGENFAAPNDVVLPDTVQIGIVGNTYDTPDMIATIHSIEFRVPTSLANCTE